LLTTVTLGRAYDEGGASPVDLQVKLKGFVAVGGRLGAAASA